MSEQETVVQEFPSQKSVEIIDNTYRLAEMADAMRQSIANAENVKAEQKKLIDVIRASDKADEFKDFVENVEKQIEDISSQTEILNIRSQLLDQVVALCKESEEAAKMTSMLLKALGIFENN